MVLKVHRGRPDAAALAAATICQRLLAGAGFPCPVLVDGPASTGGLTAVIDSLLPPGHRGDARHPATRAALATGLLEHIALLRAAPTAAAAGLSDPPAWARWQQGPWPAPHDPIFDVPTPAGWAWLEDLAARASTTLTATSPACGPRVVGHSDWSCMNATSTQGGTSGAQAPCPQDVAAFLTDYGSARGTALSGAERAAATAASLWVLAYNARCELTLLPRGQEPADGSSLAALSAHRQDHQHLGR